MTLIWNWSDKVKFHKKKRPEYFVDLSFTETVIVFLFIPKNVRKNNSFFEEVD